jgi:hypothetical protein
MFAKNTCMDIYSFLRGFQWQWIDTYRRVDEMDMRVRKPVGRPKPEIAEFVAGMKRVFGETEIDEAIRRGKAGAPMFYA